MAEVVSDHSEIDAGLEQGNGTAVSQCMGANTSVSKTMEILPSHTSVLGNQVGDAIAGKRRSMGITEDLSGTIVDVAKQCSESSGSLRPNRTQTILATLAVETDLQRASQV